MRRCEISIEAEPLEYVAFSPSEGAHELDGKAGTFWSSINGWVHFEAATRFSHPQHLGSSLPTACGNDSKWMTLAEARAIGGSDAVPPAVAFKFKIGDIVHWTNDYGVEWFGRRIVGVNHYVTFGPRYYLEPTDAHWASVHERNLAYETATLADLEAQLSCDCSLRRRVEREPDYLRVIAYEIETRGSVATSTSDLPG